MGAYSVVDAAWYLQLPASTVRSWVFGRTYATRAGKRDWAPVIRLDDPERGLLSFRNLIEVHVLSGLRRKHQVRLDAVRKAIRFLEGKFGTEHPLAVQPMSASGGHIFVEKYGTLMNISSDGQLGMSEVLNMYLERVARDAKGVPIKLYPFSSTQPSRQDPRVVVIDPMVKFGRPCIEGKGVPTSIIADRYKAGESMELLADDFACSAAQIEEAVRYEFRRVAA